METVQGRDGDFAQGSERVVMEDALKARVLRAAHAIVASEGTDEAAFKIAVKAMSAAILTETGAALAAFALEWNALPPLVRASQALSFADLALQHGNQNYKIAHGNNVVMPRRAMVTRAFGDAAMCLRSLFVALANEADDQAEAAGIGKLAYGDPSVRTKIGVVQ